MPTTVKAGDLLNGLKALQEFAGLDMPVKTGFKTQRILKRVQTEIDSVMETRKKIIEKYQETDSDGKPVHPTDAVGNPIRDQVKLKDPEAFKKDMDELDAQELNFGFDRINPAELGERITVKPAVLLALDWLFTEG